MTTMSEFRKGYVRAVGAALAVAIFYAIWWLATSFDMDGQGWRLPAAFVLFIVAIAAGYEKTPDSPE